MCQFVFVGLPPSLDVEALKPLAKAHHRRLEHEARVYPDLGLKWYFTCPFQCDCSTGVGAEWKPAASFDEVAIRTKLRKKKWGDAKIARAVASKRETLERSVEEAHREGPKRLEQRRRELAEWVSFLKGLCAASPERVGLGSLWMNGNTAKFERVEVVAQTQVTVEFLYGVEEEAVYEIRC